MQPSDYQFLHLPKAQCFPASVAVFGIVARCLWTDPDKSASQQLPDGLQKEMRPEALAIIMPGTFGSESQFHNYDAVIGVFRFSGESAEQGRQSLLEAGFGEIACDDAAAEKFLVVLKDAESAALWDAMQERPTRDPADVVGGAFIQWTYDH